MLESFGGIRNGYVSGAMDIFSYSIRICIIELKRICDSLALDILGPSGQITVDILGPSGQSY